MRILGIDPGLATIGFGVIENNNSQVTLLSYGTITTSPKLPLSKRLLTIFQEMKQLISKYQPHAIAIESLFFNKNVKTAMLVSQARGVLLLTAEESSIETFSYTPLEIKTAVSGYGFADKNQVQYMVQNLLKMTSKPKPDDAADALAIAICHSHSYKLKSYS
jgi:crossover junction endodeoxyribonuclease RuvC